MTSTKPFFNCISLVTVTVTYTNIDIYIRQFGPLSRRERYGGLEMTIWYRRAYIDHINGIPDWTNIYMKNLIRHDSIRSPTYLNTFAQAHLPTVMTGSSIREPVMGQAKLSKGGSSISQTAAISSYPA